MSSTLPPETLNAVARGNPEALSRLLPAVYEEMRRLAAAYMRGERASHTLQATALANEAYLRLAGSRAADWKGRTHFMAVAARAMRHVLVDHARRRGARKRGADPTPITLDTSRLAAEGRPVAFDELDRALERLAERNARHAQVVELRYFGGLTIEETAAQLGVSPVTVKRDWAFARAWLYRELSAGPEAPGA